MKLYAPSTIKELREKFGFNLTKTLGQNFLTDKNIIDKIIEGAEITEDDLVIEIGPGMGVITSELLSIAKKVVAIEIDTRLVPILNYIFKENDNLEIVNEDILKVSLKEIIEKQGRANFKSVKIIGNLPYYITTPIIMKILEEDLDIETITIMIQKEVADRLKAKPSTKNYGAITVCVNYFCKVGVVTQAPKEAFYPPPKVDSTVLRLDVYGVKPVECKNREMMFSLIKAGFGQRRKTLLNSLSSMGSMSKEQVRNLLLEGGIDEKRRAETLSVEDFAKLADLTYDGD